jgi:hypothetical protein
VKAARIAIALASTVLVCPAVASAQDVVSELRLVATRVQAMLTAARRAGDAIRITCLDDKLSRAHAALTEARTARGPRPRRALRERAPRILLEAEACTGAPAPPRGTIRETVVDPTIPAGDPTAVPEDGPWVDRPPSASGYY